MGQKNSYSNYSFEAEIDGNVDYDPNFDLDEYIRQKSQPQNNAALQPSLVEEQDNSQFKNAVLIFMVFAAAFLWVNDWSISQAWNSVFGGEETVATAPSFEFVVPDIPEVDIPAVPAPPVPGSESGFVDYLRALEEAGLADAYSNSGNIAMYQSGVPIDYLLQMDEAGYLVDFSYSAIIGLYNGDVTIDYLDQLNNAGWKWHTSQTCASE